MIDAILFDKDGVLVYTESAFFEVTRGPFAREGAALTPLIWAGRISEKDKPAGTSRRTLVSRRTESTPWLTSGTGFGRSRWSLACRCAAFVAEDISGVIPIVLAENGKLNK
jgi:hypothetical protein